MVNPGATVLLGLLAGTVGWTVGAAIPAVRAPFLALVGALVVVEVTAVRGALATGDPHAGRGWLWGEAVVLAVAVKAVHLFTLGTAAMAEIARYPQGFVEVETVTGWVVAGILWGLAHTTWRDVELLGYPGDGPGDPAPLQLLTRRFFRVGFLLALTGAVATVGVEGVVDLHREPATGPFLPVVGYFLFGLAGLGCAALRHGQRQWERDGARVDRDVGTRWRVTVAVVASFVVVAGLATPARVSAVGGLTPAVTELAAAFGRTAVDWFSGFERDGSDRDVPSRGAPPAVAGGSGRVGDPVGDRIRDVSLLAVLAAAAGLAFVRFGIRRRRDVPGRAGSVTAAVGRLVRDGLAALWRMLVSLVKAAKSLARPRAEPGAAPDRRQTHGPPGRWTPTDETRRRVVAEYRRFLTDTGVVAGPRRPSETSGEYAQRVAAVIADAGPVRRLTGLFDLARYTGRRLSESVAFDAAAAYRQVQSQLGGADRDLR